MCKTHTKTWYLCTVQCDQVRWLALFMATVQHSNTRLFTMMKHPFISGSKSECESNNPNRCAHPDNETHPKSEFKNTFSHKSRKSDTSTRFVKTFT